MSVDNVLAVAGAADRAPEAYRVPLLIIGLALSIPLIIAGSTLLVKVMDRFPFIIILGAALLGFLAGEMFATDPASIAWLDAHMPHAEYIFGAVFAVLVVVVGLWTQRRSRDAKA
jgi:predicted tellurium resistance membrane protein TerC